jgi:hypothetical protein
MPDIEPVSVRRSKLDWVIVRPVILTNGAKTATYRIAAHCAETCAELSGVK